MGMYDHITCDYPLPGTAPTWYRAGHQFQTKDTPEQHLSDYTISADGVLSGPGVDGFTGTIDFYSSNQSGCWGEVVYTTTGVDCESCEYRAVFVSGKLTDITQTEYERKPAITPKSMQRPSDDDIAEFNAKYSGPWSGRRIFVLWGGQTTGYHADVIAEADGKLSLRVVDGDGRYHKPGGLETSHAGFGSTMFLSQDDAFASRRSREDEYQAEVTRYRERAAARTAGGPSK